MLRPNDDNNQHLFTDQDSPLPWKHKDSLLQLLLANHDALALAEIFSK